MASSDGELYDVERIIERRIKGGKNEYLVKWEGYPDSHNSWEPRDGVKHVTAFQEFEKKLLTTETPQLSCDARPPKPTENGVKKVKGTDETKSRAKYAGGGGGAGAGADGGGGSGIRSRNNESDKKASTGESDVRRETKKDFKKKTERKKDSDRKEVEKGSNDGDSTHVPDKKEDRGKKDYDKKQSGEDSEEDAGRKKSDKKESVEKDADNVGKEIHKKATKGAFSDAGLFKIPPTPPPTPRQSSTPAHKFHTGKSSSSPFAPPPPPPPSPKSRKPKPTTTAQAHKVDDTKTRTKEREEKKKESRGKSSGSSGHAHFEEVDEEKDGFDLGLKAKEILTILKDKGHLFFLVSFEGSQDAYLIPKKKVYRKAPDVTLKFYESKLVWQES